MTTPLRLVFMGTPDFAVPALQRLIANFRVIGVVTQPDRPAGRGKKLTPSPLAQVALDLGLDVVRTPSINAEADLPDSDVMVVIAFGQKIAPHVVDVPTRGTINVHASLLPKYRGAAPIQWAVAHGDKETGVTIFRLDAEVDHGTILAQATTPIGEDETSGELFARLSVMGRDLLLKTLEDLEAGRAVAREQDHALASPAPKLRKEDGAIDWTLPAAAIHDRVRAFNPYPACYSVEAIPAFPAFAGMTAGTTAEGRVLRVHRARPEPGSAEPGVVVVEGGEPFVGTGSGRLRLVEVQWEGKPRISGRDLVNGLRGEPLRFA